MLDPSEAGSLVVSRKVNSPGEELISFNCQGGGGDISASATSSASTKMGERKGTGKIKEGERTLFFHVLSFPILEALRQGCFYFLRFADRLLVG